MTKLITAFIIIVVIFCGYQLFVYWEKVRDEEQLQKQAERAKLNPESLPGLPQPLYESYRVVKDKDTAAMRNWLKTYGAQLQDPRKAWIELDFCVAITREDPAEARRIFKSVKERLQPTSPVWPRVKQLEKSYE
jgi:hypothetical protein